MNSPALAFDTLLSFPEAIASITAGRRVTKLEWDNPEIYGCLHGTHLRLHKADGQFYDWIVSDGDLAGEDWYVVT